jgi:hypothetical protein
MDWENVSVNYTDFETSGFYKDCPVYQMIVKNAESALDADVAWRITRDDDFYQVDIRDGKRRRVLSVNAGAINSGAIPIIEDRLKSIARSLIDD